LADTVNEEKNQQEQLQQQHIFEGKAAATAGDRILLVTGGLRSKHTKTNYRLAFKQFLEHGAKTHDLRVIIPEENVFHPKPTMARIITINRSKPNNPISRVYIVVRVAIRVIAF
jgi:hypothetical protein